MIRKPKWWEKSPGSNIVGGLAVAAILWLLKLVYEWYTNAPILSTIGEWYNFIESGLLYAINFQFKLWWLVTGMIFLAFMRYLLILIVSVTDKTSSNFYSGENTESKLKINHVPFDEYKKLEKERLLTKKLEYVAEKIGGVVFKWEWIYNDLIKEHEIKHIVPCCKTPSCNNEGLKLVIPNNIYRCNICNSDLTVTNINSIESQIEKKAKLLD